MDVMRKMQFKSNNDNETLTHINKITMEVMIYINKLRQLFHKRRNIKNCYYCGSGTNMLNNCDIKETISRYHGFDKTGNVQSHHQQ